ncbi:hypothetical protein [Aeromonas dhakensis]|uniref:hypothetical protein n=1 Tax=Aeromonas dhakensis TaxID=196024 RepID=UPI0021B1E4BB|nr:hypothetical protein [Aeromonas dhakensis]UXB13752.1 hypothetical protein GP476_20870 [Aeromonas dhakensis]
MFNKFLLLIVIIFLSGCSTQISAKYKSQVDPDYSFKNDKLIIVSAYEQGNLLETKFYVKEVVNALKNKGFENVFSYNELDKVSKPIDLVIFIDVSKKTSSYQYNSPDYGMVDSGFSTTNCTGFGATLSCTENRQKTFGVIGSSTKTDIITGYYFITSWFDMKNKQNVMFTFSSSFEEGCSDQFMYKFLVQQSIDKLSFYKPEEYDFSVELPQGYSCKI